MEPLPVFKYHPHPLSSGSLIDSGTTCECCGRARGLIYTGPVYAEEELEDCLCPWCIADGSAHEKFNCEFTDVAAIGGGDWDEVSLEVKEEIAHRTPGFSAIQQGRWWTHCGDAAAYLRKEDEQVVFRCIHCGQGNEYHDFD